MKKSKWPVKTCFNPFQNDLRCSTNRNDLRPFPVKDIWKFPGADETCKLCSGCRKRVSLYEPPSQSTTDDFLSQVSVADLNLTPSCTSSLSDPVSSSSASVKDDDFHSLTKRLCVSPVEKRRVDRVEYRTRKLDEIQAAVTEKFQSQFGVLPETSSHKLMKDHESMMNSLKRVYNTENDRSVKMKLLSILPDSWSCDKVSSEFRCSKRTVLTARHLRENSPEDAEPKIGGNKPLSKEVEQLVIDFYEDDSSSRQLAGMRDTKSVKKSDGSRETKQKRLILSNLRELYASFKKEYPTVNIHFSKFASLRPQNCVIAGSSGTHSVCVCISHQNVKLMLEGLQFSTLIVNIEWIQKSDPIYSNLLKKLLCHNPTESCYNRLCEQCPNGDEIKQFLQKLCADNDVDEVKYKKWISTDRCTMITVIAEIDEFIDTLVDQLKRLLLHDYTAKTQGQFFANLKHTLKKEEFIVTLDFAENFAFIVQESVQAFHYNNDQATLLPMVVYYCENGRSQHISFVGVSDCLKHDYVTVHAFQTQLISFLKTKFGRVQKIYYFSDGAPQHFKNKNAFTNLCYHVEDFQIEAEWHFFATAHGKGACDGLAGTIKRSLRKACLQMGSECQILTPSQIFEWGSRKLTNIIFAFFENQRYLNSKTELDKRSSRSKTIKGTQTLHFISPIPNNLGTVIIKQTSNSSSYSMVQLIKPSVP